MAFDGPLIASAGLEDPSILRDILQRAAETIRSHVLADVISQPHDEGLDGRWATALGRAIERQRPENIRTLLEYGINPNGVPAETLKEVSRKFGRHAIDSRSAMRLPYIATTDEEVNAVPFQTIPLTHDEVETRRTSVSRFWIEPDSEFIDHSVEYARLHSLVMAGQTTPEIFDQVLASRADASFWLDPDCPTSLPPEDNLTTSALSISTPLHAALAADKNAMVQAIIDRGFNPNARPIITGSHTLTPAQYAIVLGNTEAYTMFRSHPMVEPDTLTPVYGAHSLHFAAAQLRWDLVEVIGLPLSNAPTTAIGHTLLHIACLPLNETAVGRSGPKAKGSYHDTRWLDRTQYRDLRLRPTTWEANGEEEWKHNTGLDQLRRDMCPIAAEEFGTQLHFCKRLVSDLGLESIALCDMHGNTALHYLSGQPDLNYRLIEWMRSQDGADEVWHRSRNYWGYTPADLFEDRIANGGRGWIITF